MAPLPTRRDRPFLANPSRTRRKTARKRAPERRRAAKKAKASAPWILETRAHGKMKFYREGKGFISDRSKATRFPDSKSAMQMAAGILVFMPARYHYIKAVRL